MGLAGTPCLDPSRAEPAHSQQVFLDCSFSVCTRLSFDTLVQHCYTLGKFIEIHRVMPIRREPGTAHMSSLFQQHLQSQTPSPLRGGAVRWQGFLLGGGAMSHRSVGESGEGGCARRPLGEPEGTGNIPHLDSFLPSAPFARSSTSLGLCVHIYKARNSNSTCPMESGRAMKCFAWRLVPNDHGLSVSCDYVTPSY